MNLSTKQIIEALTNVIYPGTKKNIVESGMLSDDIRIEGRKAAFTIIFDRATDPFLKSTVKAAEAAVHYYISKDIEVRVNAETRRKPVGEESKVLSGVKNIIAVSSGKGGVGKSTVAVNLAVALSRLGYATGLLDCDIFGPSVPKMFHIEEEKIYASEKDGHYMICPIEKYGVKTLSIGFFVAPGTATLWRGAMATNALKQLIRETDWGPLDYLILDTPPGTSDIHLTLLQTLVITGAIIVSTPQQVALSDARKGIDMYENEKVRVPILGLVENMAWFTPRELPGSRYYIFGREGCEKLAKEMNVPLLARIPLVQGLCQSGDEGDPPALHEDTPEGQAFIALAQAAVTMVNRRGGRRAAEEAVKKEKGER